MAKPSKPKAILYARYSPRPKDTDSILKQMEDLHAWCEKNDVEPILCAYDPAVSGTVSLWDRPGLSQAILATKPSYFFVVRNLNRIARKAGVALAIEEEIWDNRKATLVSIEDGGILSNDPHSRFTRLVLYGVSELQRLELNARTKRRMLQKQAEGKAMGSVPPFGYSIGPGGTLIENKAEKAILKLVRHLRSEGLGCRRICRVLNARGIPRRGGKEWTPAAVQRILSSARLRDEQQPS